MRGLKKVAQEAAHTLAAEAVGVKKRSGASRVK